MKPKKILSYILCLLLVLSCFQDFSIPIFASETKTIDLTGLVTGEDAEHTCIWLNKYNPDSHWQECVICKKQKEQSTHTLSTTGSGSCATYNVTYCTKCGYSYQEYVDHDIHLYSQEELDAMGGYNTNTNTYYHTIGYCTKCGSMSCSQQNGVRTVQDCIDANGNAITCSNRGICAVCNYDYSKLSYISHQSTQSGNEKDYSCAYCGKHIYTELWKNSIQDPNNNLHWTMSGIYQLKDNIQWQQMSNLATWSPNLDAGALTINPANVIPLPSEYYNNPKYNTQGITSGLYLVSYDANITPGYQGEMWVRMNADNCFTNINGKDYEWGKSYSTTAYIRPDSVAPSDLIVNSYGSGNINNYSQSAYIEASCVDNYSDTVDMAIYDTNGNVVLNYKTADKKDNRFTTTFDFSEADVEINESMQLIVYFRDRYGNVSQKGTSVQYIDTKAPTLKSSKDYTSEWTKTKSIKFEASDNGVGNNGQNNVLLGFNNQNDLENANFSNKIFSRDYIFTGDVYNYVTAAVYLKDSLGNIKTEFVKIGKLDNTKPNINKITKTFASNYKSINLRIEADDLHPAFGNGSGVSKYAISTSNTIEPTTYQDSNNINITKNGTYYIWVKDKAGNVSISNKVIIDNLLTQVNGSVSFDDGNDKLKVRPDKISLQLININTNEIIKEIENLSSQTSFVFSDVPMYGTDGNKAIYKVKEKTPVSKDVNLKYDVTYSGKSYETATPEQTLIIKNTLKNKNENGAYVLSGKITWIDDNNKYNFRPLNTIINVYQNNNYFTNIYVKSDKNLYSIEGLDKINEKTFEYYSYTVSEKYIDFYEITQNKYDFTNTFNPEGGDVLPNFKNINILNITNKIVNNEQKELSLSDYEKLNIEKEDLTLLVKLKEMEVKWIPVEGQPGSYKESYSNNYTGNEYNLKINLDSQKNIESFPFGKFEICVKNNNYIQLKNIEKILGLNGELIKENGKYYILFSHENENDGELSLNIISSINLWKGYSDNDQKSNYFKQ